jgi:acetolactate synthase-1/2/3 large subunit
MAEISGGELLLKCLKKEGVTRIFGIPDFAYNTLLGKVTEYGIRWITPRHESAAAHMGQGVYKTSGEIPVVMTGAGPGTANLMPGVLCAKEEGVPMIAITAQRRSDVIYPARSGVFQGLDQ